MKQKLVLLLMVSSLVFIPFFANARGLVPCGGYIDSQGTRERPCNVEDIFSLIARVTNWLIAVAGMYSVFVIANASFYVIIAVGNEESITKYKATLSNAIVGLILVFMAFMLVNSVANVFLTRSLVTNNPDCKLDLTKPLTYLTIQDTSKCSNVKPDSSLHP